MDINGLRQGLARATAPVRRVAFRGSANYWDSRYESGGTSGAGSYGPLAEYKAGVLNSFVRSAAVDSVIEFGCGDGNQLSLADYPSYLGLDVSPAAIRMCIERFRTDGSKSFALYSPDHFADPSRVFSADVALSLDVLYHLIEDRVFGTYLHHLFGAADRYVIVYSSNRAERDSAPHVRHREFTQWVEANIDGWALTNVAENPFRGTAGAIADFYFYERVP